MTLEQFIRRKDFVLIPSLHRWTMWLIAFRVTALGWLAVLGWGLATSLGVSSIDKPIYIAVCAWTAPAVIAFAAGWLLRPRVAVAAAYPDRASVGQPLQIRCALQNTRRTPLYALGAGIFLPPVEFDAAPPALLPGMLPPGESAACHVQLTPRRRGLYPMPPLRAFTTFPLNLYRTPAGHGAPWQLLVLPAFHPLHQIGVPVGTRYQPGGIALTSHTGESPEYIGNRHYVPGDSIRHIDFRAWARLAQPAVREYQEEYYCRVALVLDTCTGRANPPTPEGFPEFEAAVSLTAAIADALSRGEYLIDLFAAGPELYVFRAGRHTAHFDNVLEILAAVGHTVDNPFARLAPALLDELNNISTVICVFMDWDETREHLVRAAAEAGCSLKVIVVREGEPSRPLDALHAWTRHVRQVTPDAVRRGGVEEL
ncbi:MAG: DUF58 domain-containing protein [Candidatus Hydrogenedentes bacterium]|nr:DUF58 domain-containing protein [Candidatus Hydrogenedentota bacterium]